MTLDDDSSVLNSVERDLRAHYGQEYRIIPINNGKTALEYLKRLEQRNETVALFLVDQRMPEMSGVEFLMEAIQSYPQAKRVLLTAYADTQAAIDSINEVGLNYYLMKPWHPPEEKLYPILDELLDDWKAHVHLPYDGIRIAGTLWSLSSHEVKDFLTRHQIPYQWLDIESDSTARKLVEEASPDIKLPVVFFPDGTALISPDLRQLADKVGLQTARWPPLLRPGGDRQRSRRTGSRGLCRVGGIEMPSDREGRARWPGGQQPEDRKLPGLPDRHFRR